MKKFIAFLLALVMVVGMLAACDTNKPVETKPNESQPKETKPAETQPKETELAEPVKITIYPLNANTMSGEIGGWLGEFLLEHGRST